MKIITFYSQADRQRLGLLQMADKEDAAKSVEQSGHPTDIYRAEASKLFNTPYWLVTEQQRKMAKQVMHYNVYC